MPGWGHTGLGSRRGAKARSVPQFRPTNRGLNDPLEDLWGASPDKAPTRPPGRAGARPGSSSRELSSDDARSLEVQAQIEAESRKIAWQQTYGTSRSVGAIPAPPANPQTSAGQDQTAPVSPPSVSAKSPEPPARWREFTPIAFNAPEQTQGVYAIVQITTGRLYVGSSNDIVRRLSEHAAALRAQRHHADKLQEAWLAAAGNGFRYLLVERVHGPIEAVRDREQYWITELRAYPGGFNSKSTADGPEPSLYTQIDAGIKEYLARIYASVAPKKLKYRPDASDWSSYKKEIKAARRKKLKYAAIAFVLALVASERHSGLGVLWIGVVGFAFFILFDWPDSPQKRADARAEADYRMAEAEARRKADDLLIGQLVSELGLREETIRAAYRDAPGIVRRRNELGEKFRRQKAWLKRIESERRAEEERLRKISGVRK
jgi:hypothetical protein